ncbi:hypothetical protein U1Q18_041607 [Sarracenia purpurea var. burkii]
MVPEMRLSAGSGTDGVDAIDGGAPVMMDDVPMEASWRRRYWMMAPLSESVVGGNGKVGSQGFCLSLLSGSNNEKGRNLWFK